MRKAAIVSLAILLLLPVWAIYWDGELPPAAASPPSAVSPVSSTVPVSYEPAAAPGAAQDPAPARPAWEKAPALDAAVTKAMIGFPGRYSVVVQDLQSGQRWAVNPDARYHPASTIKMPVALYALEQYRARKIGWHDTITYTQADFESPGGGAFETAPFGGKYPIENLVGRALRYSNNVAVNMLGRHLGWENIRTWTRTIGGDLYRLPDGNPEVTAMSELGWWLHLNRLSRQDPTNAELVLQPLGEVAYTGRIAAGLPPGVAHLHKFGSYDGYFHDGGIVYIQQPYVLVVMTSGSREDQADQAIARVSAAVYKVMTE